MITSKCEVSLKNHYFMWPTHVLFNYKKKFPFLFIIISKKNENFFAR